MKTKGAYLISVRPWVFWCELPLALLLTLCILHNDGVTSTPFKLYPLMIFTVCVMIFAVLYFFRAVRLGLDELRSIGLFSSRERVMVTEGKTLVLRLEERHRIVVSLVGNDGVAPGFDWLKSTGEAPRDISLFRSLAYGGKGAVARALRVFGITESDANALIESDCGVEGEYVSALSLMKNDAREIHIKINKTV